ncbi:hypothetical protein ABT297_33740 [Dactylosporangium sp. NPDC000555]|uniref:hypothetical protein n=1 Tax=Dactylosporangium sp. NPDC000555 TaxID=3154260 RepID=UPI00332E5095
MRARKRTALTSLAGLAGAVVAAAVLGAPTSAQAAPEGAYPAPAPAIRVSAGSITTGEAVRLQGRGFIAGESIQIRVQYRITRDSGGYDNPWGVNVKGDRRADGQGRFSARVRLGMPGYAIIKVTGAQSHKTLSVAVRVQAWRNPWPDDIFAGTPLGSSPVRGHWDGGDRPVGFFGPFRNGWSPFHLVSNELPAGEGQAGTEVAAPAARHEEHRTYGADLVVGLLGLTALIGSGLITRRGIRRRSN